MSKPIERINPFLDFIYPEFEKLLFNIYKLEITKDEYYKFLGNFVSQTNIVEKYWLENPDLRFSQVLINLGIIPNIPGVWYYIEEDEILEQLGIESREYLLWGQNYDKNIKLLPKTIRKPIKDLTTEHIQAILDGGYAGNKKYLECFKNELKLRENG